MSLQGFELKETLRRYRVIFLIQIFSLYQSDPTSQVIYANDDFFVKNDPGLFKSDPNVILQTDSDFGSSCGQSRETGDTENTGHFISEPGTR